MGQLSPNFRLAFYAFNVLYFLLGAGMLGVGIYNLLSLMSFDVFGRPVYCFGAGLFIVLGVAKILLSILGIIGIAINNRYIVGIYTVLTLFAILPTLTAGIFGLQQWYFVFDEVRTALNDTYHNTAEFERTQTLRSNFRTNLRCCGIKNGEADYVILPAPTADCNAAMSFRRNNSDIPQAIGCAYYISDEIKFHLYYIGSIGLGFGFFELTAVIVAMQNVEGL